MWIHPLAFFEEHAPIAALLAADEQDDIVARGKLTNVRHAVGNLATDGVVVLEGGLGINVLIDVFHDSAEFVKWFGRLTV